MVSFAFLFCSGMVLAVHFYVLAQAKKVRFNP